MRRLLQFLAGRDSFLASHSSDAELRMFDALGLLVLVITIVTFSSTSYALYLINQDRNDGGLGYKFVLYIGVPLATCVWTLIVFNAYRFLLSSSLTLKNSFGLKKISRLLIEIFFGLMIGITLSVPISVSISHDELKDLFLNHELQSINDIQLGIDKKYHTELNQLYSIIATASKSYYDFNDRLIQTEKLKNVSEIYISAIKIDVEEANQKLQDAKEKVKKLREKITKEKQDVENFIKNNDGLITNLQKALFQNKYLVILITLFICIILIFPSIYQAYYVPGIYDFLVEYHNHISLAKRGILPHANSVFIKEDEVKVAYYTLPQELLRKNIKELKDSFYKENNSTKS